MCWRSLGVCRARCLTVVEATASCFACCWKRCSQALTRGDKRRKDARGTSLVGFVLRHATNTTRSLFSHGHSVFLFVSQCFLVFLFSSVLWTASLFCQLFCFCLSGHSHPRSFGVARGCVELPPCLLTLLCNTGWSPLSSPLLLVLLNPSITSSTFFGGQTS